MKFRDTIPNDNENVFLNYDEFAEDHDLNGTTAKACIQNDTFGQGLTTGSGDDQTYLGIYGSQIKVYCLTDALPEVPIYGQTFSVDGKGYLVMSVANDVGMLCITLLANDR